MTHDRWWTKTLDWAFDAWWLDYVVVIAGYFAVTMLPAIGASLDLLGGLSLERRIGAYSDLIAIATLLAGFSSVAFTTYLGWSSRGIRTVKRKIGLRLLIVWLVGIATPWLCAVVLWIASVLDQGDAGLANNARWLALAALVLVILSLIRIIVIFIDLARLNDEDPAPTKTPSSAPLAVPASRLQPRRTRRD